MVRATLALMLCAVVATAEAVGKEKGKLNALLKSPTSSVPGGSTPFSNYSKLRESMMKWYCPNHADAVPCKTFAFMQSLKESKTPEDRKKAVLERQKTISSMSETERKAYQAKSKEEYSQMYTQYCAPGSSVPDKNEEVCSNELFKRIYTPKTKPAAAAA